MTVPFSARMRPIRAPQPQQLPRSPRPMIPRQPAKPAGERSPRVAQVLALKPLVRLDPVMPDDARMPDVVLEKYGNLLSKFEKTEIRNFPEIYFLGRATKRMSQTVFDDKEFNYKAEIGEHLAYRFEVIRRFGQGAFGSVFHCFDHKKKQNVAVKILVNTAQMHEQGQIEAKILAKLNKARCKSIVAAFDIFVFRSHICVTFEILGVNLYELSEAQEFKPMSINVVQGYAKQILQALAVCHGAGIVHCDLKPENVLVLKDDNERVKVIDFGSSCFTGQQVYDYIQSRFYRAPEVILGIPYGPPMDVWSTALIVVEMLLGKPLFSGDDELHQLHMFIEVFGSPPDDVLARGKRSSEFFDEEGTLTVRKGRNGKPGALPLSKILRGHGADFVSFICSMMTWRQEDRATVKQCLAHPFITGVPPAGHVKVMRVSSAGDVIAPLPAIHAN